MKNKQELVDKICELVNFATADANTYLYVKCISSAKHDSEVLPIGGGNFTVLLSTLATIELLGTVDAILDGNADNFWTEDEIEQLEKSKEEILIKLKNSDESIKNFVLRPFNQLPQKGDLKKGTMGTIKSFLKKTKDLTGLDDKEIEILLEVRNKLVHEFTPKIIPAAALPFMPGEDFHSLISSYSQRKVFCLTSANTKGIDANALNHKLFGLLQYVIKKFEGIKNDKLVKIEKFLNEL